MTIFIEHYISSGFCKWENGKILVSANCPKNVREELAEIDRKWREIHPDSGSIVIFLGKSVL